MRLADFLNSKKEEEEGKIIKLDKKKQKMESVNSLEFTTFFRKYPKHDK